jgi:hypothetical protein
MFTFILFSNMCKTSINQQKILHLEKQKKGRNKTSNLTLKSWETMNICFWQMPLVKNAWL